MQMKKILENEQGSMAVYVFIVLFSFLIILTSIYFSAVSIRKAQLETVVKIKQSYELDNNNVDEIYAKVNNETYVTSGLVLQYDGINNTGSGHSDTATIWKDLSGNGNDGTLQNFAMSSDSGWTQDGLKFDGVDDNVSIREMNLEKITVEIMVKIDEYNNSNIIGNVEAGGYQILAWNDRLYGKAYISGTYRQLNQQKTLELKKSNIATLIYDGKNLKFIVNGELQATYENSAGISAPINSTYVMLGANPSGNTAMGEFFKGSIYSVRIYTRALTDAEIAQNYEIDKARFGL